jgi:hypothetical protein
MEDFEANYEVESARSGSAPMWIVLMLATMVSLGGLALLISCEEADEYRSH